MKTQRGARKFRTLHLGFVLLFGTAVWALIPENIRENDPLRPALYHTEKFNNHEVHVPNTPVDAKDKLLAMLLSDPQNTSVLRELAAIEIQLQDFASAESHLKQFVEKSADKDEAYTVLEDFYHSRLQFDAELRAMIEHARVLKPAAIDIERNSGAYGLYKRILVQLSKYGLKDDPAVYYQASIDSYPDQKQPYLDFVVYLKGREKQQEALAILDRYKTRFPDDIDSYLNQKAALLKPEEAFTLLSQNYKPLWNLQLMRSLDAYAVSSGKKGEYLATLRSRIQKDPLDFDAVTRLFYSYYLAGSLPDAQGALNDFRLLKEQSVRDKKSAWKDDELFVMAELNRILANFNESARYDYALYSKLKGAKPSGTIHADDALYGIFQCLMAADENPVQIGAGNIDYYKDIATLDSNPGILNGILSLVLNGESPAYEWEQLQTKTIGYYNRAQALRLIRIAQRDYPASKHLSAMYSEALKIYEKYNMNELIVSAGQDYFKNFASAPELVDVAVAVTDAYARLGDHAGEWKTYEFALPIAAAREKGHLYATAPSPVASASNMEDDESEDEDSSADDSGEDSDDDENEDGAVAAPPQAVASSGTYAMLLNRYISSLTQEKKHMEVVKLYRDQIQQHPEEQQLYENFATYLSQNQLFDDEAQVYRQAIDQFKEKNWYEKLARWYLRQKRDSEFEAVSHQIIDTFQGTEVASYVTSAVSDSDPYRSLYVALNRYSHDKFPYNLTFVRNLLGAYAYDKNEQEWEDLSAQYYFLDESIRNGYLYTLARDGNIHESTKPTNTVEEYFAGDANVWRSHFEEAVPHFRALSAKYPANERINLLLADLERSLGVNDPAGYDRSAHLREQLAKITPSDASLWTSAGETVADVEDYDRAKTYWQNILKIDPMNPDRYLEVATILWDYYLFDDALATIEQARKIKNDPELFAYEAGAIQESKRDYDSAIREYSKSLVQDSEMARNRLTVLYQRPKWTPLVQKYLDQQLTNNPQEYLWWTGIIRFYADQKDRARVRDLIGRAINTLNPQNFAFAVGQLEDTSRSLGFDDLEEKLIQSQIAHATNEQQTMQLQFNLARFYESRNKNAEAEDAYRKVYKKNPRSAGVIDELLSYYWRSEQYAKAFGVYKDVIPASNAKFKTKYLLDSARKYFERQDYASAMKPATELASNDPMNTEYFQLIAEIYAAQKNYAGLAEHYKQGLQRMRDSNLPDDQKKAQIASLRRGIIDADIILKDYTAALDQYIEILNRDAENDAVVTETATFASKYNLLDRLFAYYQKASADSSKDHRWPMVLGKLHFFSGDFDAGIKDFQTAISIHPERTDLIRLLAEGYQRLGQYKEAIATYEKLYAMTYKDKQWLAPMAELYARLGNTQKALDLYGQTITDTNLMTRNFALSGKALDWGLPKDAARFGSLAVDAYFKDPSAGMDYDGFDKYIEAIVRSGMPVQAFGVIQQTLKRIDKAKATATFDAEELRSTEYLVRNCMTTRFPEFLKLYATGDQLEAVEAAMFQETNNNPDWKKDLFLPLARAAGMARAEEQLLKEMVAHADTNHYRTYRNDLFNFYRDRMAYAKAAEWMESEWKTHKDPLHREDLAATAEQFRLAGDQPGEVRILREYYLLGKTYDLEQNSVERYLSLLYSTKNTEELKQAALNASVISANYFVKKKDKDLSLLAIDSLSKAQPAVWGSVEKAMLGWELRDSSPEFDTDFKTGLDVRTIGLQLSEHSDEGSSLLGDEWFYYGTRYGEYLHRTKQTKDAEAYLQSDLEAAPTNGERQATLATFYMDEKENEPARDHYALALQLEPRNGQYIGWQAEALYRMGRKEEAIAMWKSLLDLKNNAYRYQLLVDAAAEHEFIDSVRPDVEAFLSAQIAKTGGSGLDDLLTSYFDTLTDEAKSKLLGAWLPSAPAPREFGKGILANATLSTPVRLQIYSLVRDYLRSWMISAAGADQATARNQWASWSLEYANELIEAKQPDRALTVVSEALDRIDKDQNALIASFTLLKAKTLLRSGRKEEALKALDLYLQPEDGKTIRRVEESEYNNASTNPHLKAANLLREEGFAADADNLLIAMYEKQMDSGAVGSATYLGLAELKLKKQDMKTARDLLRLMIYLTFENLQGLNDAADLMERQSKPAEAVEYRMELAKRQPMDMHNHAQLATDLVGLDRKQDAAGQALLVLQSDFAQLSDRSAAAEVYGKTSVKLAGPAEMQKIELEVRGDSTSTLGIYSRSLRAYVLQHGKEKPLPLLLAQRYMEPTASALDLFKAFRAKGQCEAALRALDPDETANQSSYGGYSDDDEYSSDEYYDDEDSGYSSNYPVETLSLSEEETRVVAMQMAECAEKIDNDAARLFYLNMALAHETSAGEQQKIRDAIDKTQTRIDERNDAEAKRFKVSINLGRAS